MAINIETPAEIGESIPEGEAPKTRPTLAAVPKYVRKGDSDIRLSTLDTGVYTFVVTEPKHLGDNLLSFKLVDCDLGDTLIANAARGAELERALAYLAKLGETELEFTATVSENDKGRKICVIS